VISTIHIISSTLSDCMHTGPSPKAKTATKHPLIYPTTDTEIL